MMTANALGSKADERPRKRVAATLLQRMRDDLLRAREGDLFGSEELLLSRYDVSRPTLREALSVLGSEELLQVRRGWGGGYYVSRPSAETIARMAGNYLSGRGSNLADAVSASLPLRILVARLAARGEDNVLRAALQHRIEHERSIDAYERAKFLASERDILLLLARLGGNAVAELMLAVIIAQSSLEQSEHGLYRPETYAHRAARMRRERAQLLDAVQAGDEELAEHFARRCGRLISKWMKEDGYAVIDA
jgi:DNA-binding FadR family transcriptional regulator